MERPIKFVTRVKPDTPLAVDLFGLGHDAARFEIERSNEVDLAIAAQAPVFIGVSGRRDSQALAYRGCDHLDDAGDSGARLLIHSDLGRVEWRDSLPVCERLAQRLGVDLVVVRRKAGDMIDRWRSRWTANVARYANVECVKAHPAVEHGSATLLHCGTEVAGAGEGDAASVPSRCHRKLGWRGERPMLTPFRASARGQPGTEPA